MEMNAAKKAQYRHKLTGEDVRNWHPLTVRGFWLPSVLLIAVVVALLVVNMPWQ